MPVLNLKNKGPLLVDKVRGYFDRLPPWLRERITVRVEHQKVDAKIDDLDPVALESELKQEVTDEKLRTNRYLGDGEPGSGNDLSGLPASHPSKIVLTNTGQVADVSETASLTQIPLVEGPPLQDGQSEQVGDVWVTKQVTAPTFDDKVFQLTKEDLIPPEFRALVPEKLEAHTVDGTAALPTLGSGETVRREEQKKVGTKTVSVQSRDLTTPPVITGEKIDPQWNGATLDLEQRIVPATTVITQPFGTTDANIKPIDGTNALQETWRVRGSFPETVQDQYDPGLQTVVHTHQTIELEGSTYSPVVGDLDFEEKYIDALHVMRRVDRVPQVTDGYFFESYSTMTITFPGILSSLSFALVSLATANRKEPQWTAGVRAPITTPVAVRSITQFYWTQPAPQTIFQWATTDILFKGLSYSLNLSNVLTDTWTNIGVTYASDAYYGNTVDRFSISATTPSASGYVGLIGVEASIACVIERYKRLWVKKTSFVKLQ